MMPITPFINTTFPEITRSIVSRSWKQLKQLLKKVTLISASWTVGVTVILGLFGKWLIGLFYGIEFVPALPILMILLIGFGVSNIFFWNRTLLLSFGKANIPLFIMLGAALLKVGLGFVFVPHYGVNAEAALLSGNLVLSVGLLVGIGLSMINKQQRLDIESAAK
jgi:O-antigen/teichoic acid export membrane protein